MGSLTYSEIIEYYPEHFEEIYERSAIIEFDGEESRERAEQLAAEIMHSKYLLFKQGHLFNGGRYERD